MKKEKLKEASKIAFVMMLCFFAGFATFGAFGERNFHQIASDITSATIPESPHDIKIDKEDYLFITKAAEEYETEVGLCFALQGGVYKAVRTEMIRTNKTQVTYRCPENSIMDIHTHPNGVCMLSKGDKEDFINRTHYFSGVACGYNKSRILNRQFEKVNIELVE